MTKNYKKEAPIIPLKDSEATQLFHFTIPKIVNTRNSCMALRDFRQLSVNSMRAMHHNHRTLVKYIDDIIAPEEELIADINDALYGPGSDKLTPEQRDEKRKELKKIAEEYKTKIHEISLHTIPDSDFADAMLDPKANFPVKQLKDIGEVDLLTAYFDMSSEGLIV